MPSRSSIIAVALTVLGGASQSAFRPGLTAEEELAAIVKAFAALSQPADWSAVEQLPGIRWAPLPPTMLQNCAPDGNCFARQGAATVGGRRLAVIATGARTMVFNVYLRNGGAPFGEAAVLSALQSASLTTTLARCPVRGSRGSTNWYRLGGANVSPAHLSIQPANDRGAGEGFVLSAGAELPKLQPNQLALYSEQCAAGAVQRPVATALPHEQLAGSIVALLIPTNGPASYDWRAMAALPTGVAWDSAGPKRVDLSYRNDRNPNSINGTVAYGGRQFSVMASGAPTQVKIVYFDEMGLHRRGEHLLGVVYRKGVTVQLVRCGPAYTESTNNWYSLTSAHTRPAMIRQSIRYDGNQVQDVYELRLDGSLPSRDPRDRNPGVGGCQ
jgi:hypothetical protein